MLTFQSIIYKLCMAANNSIASVPIYSHRYIKVKIMSIVIHSAIDNGKHTAYYTLKRMAFNQDVCRLPRPDLIS